MIRRENELPQQSQNKNGYQVSSDELFTVLMRDQPPNILRSLEAEIMDIKCLLMSVQKRPNVAFDLSSAERLAFYRSHLTQFKHKMVSC